jgi:hypothetical protein
VFKSSVVATVLAIAVIGCGAEDQSIGTADGVSLNNAMGDIADYCGAAADGGDFPEDKLLKARETILDTAARISGQPRREILPELNGSSGTEVCDPSIADEVQRWISSEGLSD